MTNHSEQSHRAINPTAKREADSRSQPKVDSAGIEQRVNHKTPSRIDSSFTHFEVVFCIYAILFYTEFWWALTKQLGPAILLIRYSILGISMILLSLRAKTLIRILPKGKWLWVYCAIGILSITWSINVGLTFIGTLQTLVQVCVFGLYFASRFNPKHQLYVLGCALGITVLVDLFYILALPSVGIHVGDKFAGAWKGFHDNKNAFSGVMLWSLAVFYLLSFKDSNRMATRLARVGLFISPLLIILSTSKTALILFISLFVSLAFWGQYLWRGRRTILAFDIALFSVLIVVGGVVSQWVPIVTGLGKDPTLSGRTVIWVNAIAQINQRPLLGYGYSAFWSEDNPAARSIGDALYTGFYTYHSHNGFLDVLLNVGWIGLGIFAIGFISTWTLALKYAYKPTSPGDTWPLAVMVLITLYNTTESTLISDNINWLFYVIAYLSVRIWPRQPLSTINAAPDSKANHSTAKQPATAAAPPSTAADSSY